MWILEWLPNWMFYAIFFAGILGVIATYVLGFIPFLSAYKIPVQVVSIIAIVVGTYMAGAISNEESWLAKVKEVEIKVAKSEVESAKENTKIVEKIVKKIQIVQLKGAEVIKYVDREVVKYDTKFAPGGQCEIPKEFIKALNDAAKPPETTK